MGGGGTAGAGSAGGGPAPPVPAARGGARGERGHHRNRRRDRRAAGTPVQPAAGSTARPPGPLDIAADGQVVDFSAAQWNSTTAKWCDADGLDGGLTSYAGTSSTAAAAVDTTAQNLKLNFMVVAGGYAGGRVNFDSCVDAGPSTPSSSPRR